MSSTLIIDCRGSDFEGTRPSQRLHALAGRHISGQWTPFDWRTSYVVSIVNGEIIFHALRLDRQRILYLIALPPFPGILLTDAPVKSINDCLDGLDLELRSQRISMSCR